MTTSDFIAKARTIHGNRYDYSVTNYQNRHTKVAINCNACQTTFTQRPDSHLRGANCPRCARTAKATKTKHTTITFVGLARAKHGDTFDYSNTNYNGSNTKVIIKCTKCEHQFLVTPHHHLAGSGCPNCHRIKLSANKTLTTTEFITKAHSRHGNKYNYELSEYCGHANPIIIRCYGCDSIFTQLAGNHLAGSGCPHCSRKAADTAKIRPTSAVIDELVVKFGDHFDYSQVAYSSCKEKITVVCKRCGNGHRVLIHNHRANAACHYCNVSNGHRQLIDYINGLGSIRMVINDRETINPYELDIHVPDHKLAIEFNGLYHHSFDHQPTPAAARRHQTKAIRCAKAGISLLQFWSSEWDGQPDVVRSMIAHKLGKSTRIAARKCDVATIDQDFFAINHIQGARRASITLGLVDGGRVVCGMSFSRHSTHDWEIMRYANLLGHTVVGGASRLFKNFVSRHRPSEVLSYSDLRFSNGSVYDRLGFVRLGMTRPNYHYTDSRATALQARQRFQKHKLIGRPGFVFDAAKSEVANCLQNGLRLVFDAGHLKWLWKAS